MPSAVPFTGRRFVPDRYEPNSGRLVDLARQRGRDQGESIRRGGDISANLWSGIGQNVAGTLRELAAMPEQARQRQIQDQRAQREEQAYQTQRQQQQQDAANQKRFTELVQQYQGRIPSEVLVQNFGHEDAAKISKDLNELFPPPPVPKAPEPFTLNPGDTRFDGAGQQIANVPKPEPVAPRDTNPTEASLALLAANGDAGAKRALAIMRAQRPASGGSDNEPLETIIGPDGKPVRVRRSDAVGKSPASGTEKPSSGVQKRVLNFFNRAEQADKDLEALEPEIMKMGAGGQARMSWAPNFAQTPTGRQYNQAQRAFTEARLRKDSGAAIPPHEFESDRQTYFPQPFDDAATLVQKRRARAAMLASLGFESGQALGEFLGNSDEAVALVEHYKTRAKAPLDGTTQAVPDLKGLKPTTGRKFTDGPFAGQTWSVDAQGRPYKVGG